MVPVLVPGQVDLLDPAVPIPTNCRERAVEALHGPALGILEVEVSVSQTPLDAVTGSELALLFPEHIDLGGSAQTRIPLDGPAILIRQDDSLAPTRVASDAGHLKFCVAGDPEVGIVASEHHDLTPGIEAR